MRKPLVVVSVAASALLLAGGIAATTAGAEERPDDSGFAAWAMPGWDWISWGGETDLGGVGDDGGDPDDSWAGDDRDGPAGGGDGDGGPGGGEDPAGGPDGAGPNGPNGASGDGPAGDGADGSGDDAASDPAAGPAGGVPEEPRDRTRPARPNAASQSDATRLDMPPAPDDAPRRANATQRDEAPAAPRRVAERPAVAAGGQAKSGLVALARRNVTAADVSTSPNARVQQHVLGLVNQSRRRGGCESLSIDRRLIEAANDHAADMARRRYFAHRSPNGDNAGERVSDAGYNWKRYGENIARGADSAYEVWNGWMNSPEHRENILDCRLHQMGIGLAIADDGTEYWVQDFATPMK